MSHPLQQWLTFYPTTVKIVKKIFSKRKHPGGVVFYFPGLSPEILANHSLSRLHTQVSGVHTHTHALLKHLYAVCVCSVCPILCNPTDCNLPGSSVDGILQARILEWAAISSSRRSSRSRDQTCISCVSCIGRQILYCWASGEARSICTQTCYSLDFFRPVRCSWVARQNEMQRLTQVWEFMRAPGGLLPWFWK